MGDLSRIPGKQYDQIMKRAEGRGWRLMFTILTLMAFAAFYFAARAAGMWLKGEL